MNRGDRVSGLMPYAGSSGWAGSETSKARADQDDMSGTTGSRQRLALVLLESAGHAGLTYKELCKLTGWHHGQSSGTLSVLHKEGRIERLQESRGGCRVYVHCMHVAGRATELPGSTAAAAKLQRVRELASWLQDNGHAECARHIDSVIGG